MAKYFTLYLHEKASLLPRLARRGFAPNTYLSSDLDWLVEDALEESEEDQEAHVVLQLRVLEDYLVVDPEDIAKAILEEDKEEEEWEEEDEGEPPEEPEPGAPEEEWQEDPEQLQYDIERRLRELEAERKEYEEERAALVEDEDWEGVEEVDEILAENAAEYEDTQAGNLWAEEEEEEEEEPAAEAPPEPERPAFTEEEAAEWAERMREAGLPYVPPEEWPQTMDEAIELTGAATLVHRLPPTEAKVLGIPEEIVEGEQTQEEARTEAWFRFNLDRAEPLTDFKQSFIKHLFQRFTGKG